MFPIIPVPDHAADATEPLGTKPKFWFRDDDGRRWLYKEGRPGTGEDWSEKAASELCALIGLPHVDYELALWKNRRGVVCRSLVPPSGRLIHGNEFMAKIVPEYPQTKSFGVRQHTVKSVLAVLRRFHVGLPLDWNGFAGVQTAQDVFIGYLMLDAWIANQDRHHENWAIVTTANKTIHLAPSFDHASSLGRNETDEQRQERLVTNDQGRSITHYVERAKSAFYHDAQSPKTLSTIQAFREAGKTRPSAADAWLERLKRVASSDIQQIFNQIPEERITPIASEFAQRMLELNCERLLSTRPEILARFGRTQSEKQLS